MKIASLQQFIVLIPTCEETDALEEIGQLFQQSACDQIVILNPEKIPLGVLTFRQFISRVVGQPLVSRNESSRGEREINLQDSAQVLLPLLEPLPSLPAQWSIEEIQPYLHQLEQRDWALVDSENRFVGLLDRLRLLQFLAIRSTVAASAPKKVKAGKRSAASLKPPAIEAPESGNGSSATAAVDPLIDLLERMPIPLMLQTSTGRVITQNLAWRQQVGELRDPGQVRREAAVILEATQWEDACVAETQCFPEEPSRMDAEASGRSMASHAHLSNLPSHDPATTLADTARHPGSCHFGTEPNSCVCICPMKNGQERVWKFLKVPMGSAPTTSLQSLEMTAAGLSAAVSESSPYFKLATLGFSPDPTWRSLSQTEFLWLVLAQDMTEQHQIARELAAKNADLVQLNRLKDEFLSCISHELKTPLTAVLGLSSLLKDHMLGDLNERQSRYAHLIYQSGRHLILIVNDILDLTRIETGQLDLTLEPVDIRAACLEAYQQAQHSHARDTSSTAPDSEHAAIQFSLEIQPDLTTIVADEIRLRQMLTNLVSNALKFTEGEGAIGLKVEAWEGWIAFTVWDTGIGIPTDKQHLIFQKFQQLENPLTRQFEGTGLGLVLTQRLARLHGGDVTFTSIEGQGSQFTLLLPPSPPQALPDFKPQVLKTSQSPSVTAGNRLALVVEAMPQQIEELSRQLVQLGYRVAIARSGTEALEKSRRLQPGVIFLNPSLPMLSGWDVLTLLKTDEATRDLPVVVTATRVEREQACQSGANGFLSLPIQPEPLQRCLARLIEQTKEEPACYPNLTVLHLHGSVPASEDAQSAGPMQDAHRLLYPYQCRVLEVDDLEQADLLARVWKPNVILMDGIFPDPFAYLKQLSQYPTLASLPLVTLTVEITHAANLVPGLVVFPCLATASSQLNAQTNLNSTGDAATAESSALWQAIQIAVGIHWTPHILIADLSLLESNWAATTPADLCQNLQLVPGLTSLNSVQAAVHYLQIAGFRCSMGQSWQEVVQQLEHRSVDVLLFCVHAHVSLHLFLEISQTLEQLETKPPVLVWNCTAKSPDHDSGRNQNSQANVQTLWGAITSQILPCNLSMSDLLAQVNQVLSDR